MQKSRLAQRKLGVKPNSISKKKPPRNYLTVTFLFLLTSAVLLFLCYLFLPKTWDGKSKLSIVSQLTSGDVQVETLDPVNGNIFMLTIPADVLVDAANQLGTWKLGSITKLGVDKKLSSNFLKNTVIKSFNFPVEDTTDLTLLDKIRIKLFTMGVGSSDVSSLNLKDTNYLTRAKLVDGSLGWKIGNSMPTSIESYFNENFSSDNLAVIVNNATGESGEGNMVAAVVGVLGGNVASVQNLEPKDYNCVVTGNNKDFVSKVAKLFSCKVVLAAPSNNFDVEIELGSLFKDRF